MCDSWRFQMFDHGRALRHEQSEGSTTQPHAHRTVGTAEQLLTAVTAGAPHIELRQHLDLSVLPLLHTYAGEALEASHSILGALPSTVQTIQGNCTAATPAAEALDTAGIRPPLAPLREGQCLLLADSNIFSAWHWLWLDSVYLRHKPSARAPGAATLIGGHRSSGGGPAALYLTHSTLQGAVRWDGTTAAVPSGEGRDGNAANAESAGPAPRGADVTGTLGLDVAKSVYAEDCTFTNLGGAQHAAVLLSHTNATAAFTNCTFQNTRFSTPAATDPAVPPAAVRTSAGGGSVRLEQCRFRHNAVLYEAHDAGPADVAVAPGSRVFGDRGASGVAATEASEGGAWPAGLALGGGSLQPLAASRDVEFLSAGDEWLLERQGAMSESAPTGAAHAFPAPLVPATARAPPVATEAPPPATQIGSGAIALFAIFSIAAVICISLAIFWCWWRLPRDTLYAGNFPAAPMSPVKPPVTLPRAHTASVSQPSDGKHGVSPGHPAADAQIGRDVGLTNFASFPEAAASQRLTVAHSNPFFDFTKTKSPSYSPTAADSLASSSLSTSLLYAHRTAAATAAQQPPPVALLRLQLDAAEALRRRPPPQPLSPWSPAGSPAGAAAEGALRCAASGAQPPPPLPAADAPIAQRIAFVHQQLDSIAGREVLPGLILDPRRSRRLQGGQAVIQFGVDRQTEAQWAVKFFLSARGFANEAALYRDPGSPLGPFLPLVRNIIGARDPADPLAAAERILDAHGRPLPPCIVMERGESLDIWRTRNAHDGIDVFTALQIVNHIAERLAALHSAGHVHRDIKPSNVMWLPRRNRWTLIDFGCAARAGAHAPVSFTPAYAPPEVVRAHRSGAHTVVADPKADAWALGTVALEVFCNRPALDLMQGEQQVMARLAGELPLPWEDEQASTPITHALGRYRGTVLALVRRDPARRASVAEFIQLSRDLISRTSLSAPREAPVRVLDAADDASTSDAVPAAAEGAGAARRALILDIMPHRSSI
eukprot:jgi/Ulvmu1/8700/UM047_0040.1